MYFPFLFSNPRPGKKKNCTFYFLKGFYKEILIWSYIDNTMEHLSWTEKCGLKGEVSQAVKIPERVKTSNLEVFIILQVLDSMSVHFSFALLIRYKEHVKISETYLYFTYIEVYF